MTKALFDYYDFGLDFFSTFLFYYYLIKNYILYIFYLFLFYYDITRIIY
jgi:hypothetical protein